MRALLRANAGLFTALQSARPGISERESAAEIEYEMRRAGSWDDPLQITRTSSQQLVAGTSFVLDACLFDESAGVGVVAGGTYAVTEAGVEVLAAGAPELAPA
jgi:hypothetical protein